jgi:rSAM/selenodomain-associated transferase 1
MSRPEPTRSIQALPVHVIVMAKAPLAGRVKTRLCPPLSFEQAALVAEAALSDTLAAVRDARVRERTVVLDGEPGAWIPPHFRVIAQRTGPFADRLAGAIADAFFCAPGPILLIGMDTPQLRADQIEEAATKLIRTRTDAVLGLAEDGGFWLIGTERPIEGMFDTVEMSTSHTGKQQLARLKSLRLRCELLPKLRDVDEWSDALSVAGHAPESLFAAAVSACMLATDGRGPQVARHG